MSKFGFIKVPWVFWWAVNFDMCIIGIFPSGPRGNISGVAGVGSNRTGASWII